MFTSQREKPAAPYIIAIVELDMKKMRVRIVLAREAIRERLLELELSDKRLVAKPSCCALKTASPRAVFNERSR